MVDVRCNREFTGVPQVETDNRLVAELAFKHSGIVDFVASHFVDFALPRIQKRDYISSAH
jgi:hypothetical protein